MASTAQILTYDAYEQIKARDANAPPSLIPRLMTMVPAAMALMAERVAAGPGYEGLQKDYFVTPVDGLIDLAELPNILFDINKSRIRITGTGVSIQAIDSYETLENGGLPNDRPYYAQDGHELRFRSTTPSLTDFATPVQIKANYIPTPDDGSGSYPLPTQYEPAVVATLVEMAASMPVVVAEAKELAETGRA